MRHIIRAAAFSLSAFLVSMSMAPQSTQAQDLFIYPSKGQSQEQQDRDRYECHNWAVQQTGFDPSRAQPQASGEAPPPQEAPQGGVLRGGARGALGGLAVGAIAGDAGKGAAIGAAGGALIGGFRRRDQQRRHEQERRNYEQAQSQQQATGGQQRDAYHRAMTACLQGRGYTVN